MAKTVKQLPPIVLPSKFISEHMSRLRKEARKLVADKYNLALSEAEDILTNEPEWQAFLKEKEREYSLGLLSLSEKFVKATIAKIEAGSMEQAKSSVVALGIIKNHVFGETTKSKLNIEGENIQVNLGFDFKPYDKKRITKSNR